MPERLITSTYHSSNSSSSTSRGSSTVRSITMSDTPSSRPVGKTQSSRDAVGPEHDDSVLSTLCSALFQRRQGSAGFAESQHTGSSCPCRDGAGRPPSPVPSPAPQGGD